MAEASLVNFSRLQAKLKGELKEEVEEEIGKGNRVSHEYIEVYMRHSVPFTIHNFFSLSLAPFLPHAP